MDGSAETEVICSVRERCEACGYRCSLQGRLHTCMLCSGGCLLLYPPHYTLLQPPGTTQIGHMAWRCQIHTSKTHPWDLDLVCTHWLRRSLCVELVYFTISR